MKKRNSLFFRLDIKGERERGREGEREARTQPSC